MCVSIKYYEMNYNIMLLYSLLTQTLVFKLVCYIFILPCLALTVGEQICLSGSNHSLRCNLKISFLFVSPSVPFFLYVVSLCLEKQQKKKGRVCEIFSPRPHSSLMNQKVRRIIHPDFAWLIHTSPRLRKAL